jgi:iron complex outermembrane recepter protein
MKKIYLTVAVAAMAMSTYAQSSQITGRVVDAKTNEPVAGASVHLAGHKASTDNNGSFTIECTEGKEISINHIGYGVYTQKIKNCGEALSVQLVTAVSRLNEVEITASSNPNKQLLYQPVSITKLETTEIKRGTGLYLDDAINTNVPGVLMERRTVAAGQQFNIRGYGNGARGTNGVNSNFDGQGYKVYLNGIPVTDAEGITLMDDIDFGSVDNVEVVKGPAGTVYGLAIAGVVNLKTTQAEKGKVSIGQDAMVGSYGLQRYTTRVQIGGERSSLLVNYGKQQYDGFMSHTASHKDFVNMVGEFHPNEKQSISTYIGYSNSYDQRNGELTINQYDIMDYSGNPAYIKNDAHSNVTSFRAGVGHSYEFNKHFSNTTSIFGTGVSSNVSSAGGWTDKTPINYGLRSVLDAKFDLTEKAGLSGISGVELQQQNAQTLGYGMVADSANLSGYNIIGAMRSNQYTVSKTWSAFTEWTLSLPHELSVTSGVGVSNMAIDLYDHMYAATNNNPSNPKATNNPTDFGKAYNGLVSGHFAVNKVIKEHVSVYASYSSGYKAPVSSYFYIPLTGQLNTSLVPEKGTQYEVGSKGSLMNGKLFYQAAIFNAIFANKMTAVAVPNAANTATSYTYVANGGEQNNMGLEALVKYTAYQSSTGFFKSVSPFVNMAYSDFTYNDFKFQKLSTDKKNVVETDFSGNKVAGVSPITFNAGVDVLTKIGLYGNVNLNYRDAMYFTSDNLNKTKAYSVLNAKVGIQRTIAGHFGLDLFVGAVNITGTQYPFMVFLNQLPDAYLPAPREMNFFGGLNVKYTF